MGKDAKPTVINKSFIRPAAAKPKLTAKPAQAKPQSGGNAKKD